MLEIYNKPENNLSFSTIKIICILVLIGIFMVFRIIHTQERKNTERSVLGLLRNEAFSANSYALSKTISDIETIGLAKCIRVSESTAVPRIFYDTSSNSNCLTESYIANIFSEELNLHAINGLTYSIKYQPHFSWSFLILEILSYILICVSFYLFSKDRREAILNNELRLTALTLEKNMMVKKTTQAKHDIASPLTALRTIVGALKNIDPEIKDFLSRTLARTEDIFKELSQPTSLSLKNIHIFDVKKSVLEIVNEKEVLWNSDKIMNFTTSKNDYFALGDEKEFKRILSNLTQNSYEAFETPTANGITISIIENSEKILISIKDSGKGMSQDILSKLGSKGFSFGKHNHPTAGTGLGVNHAVESLRNWGGDLSYESAPNQGTTAKITLVPKIQNQNG